MLYHERECENKENANFVHIVYLLTKLCNIFDEAFFIDASIHVVQYHNQINQLLVFIFSQECYTKY